MELIFKKASSKTLLLVLNNYKTTIPVLNHSLLGLPSEARVELKYSSNRFYEKVSSRENLVKIGKIRLLVRPENEKSTEIFLISFSREVSRRDSELLFLVSRQA